MLYSMTERSLLWTWMHENKLLKCGLRHVNFGVAAFQQVSMLLHAVWQVNTQNKNGMTMEA
jgi:hypothetical protein